MRTHFTVAVVAVAALGALILTSAWVFYVDDRQPSHSPMVGTLQVDLPEGRGRGTAVLVDECGILTNFHVVFGPWYVTELRAPSHAFPATFILTEVTLPDGSHPAARATPVVWGDYRGPDRQIRSAGNDWAYLVLDRCLGAERGYFSLRPLDPEELGAADRFVAIGYSSGRQKMDPDCSVRAGSPSIRKGAWPHDCALRAGDSGGPIVRRGTISLVALGSSFFAAPGEPSCAVDGDAVGSGWNERCANLAVPLTWEVIERVRAAEIASGVQRALIRLGYDAGPLGAVDEPRARDAIGEFQRAMRLAVTGEPSDSLWKILLLQLYGS